jgi:hypothetical protein
MSRLRRFFGEFGKGVGRIKTGARWGFRIVNLIWPLTGLSAAALCLWLRPSNPVELFGWAAGFVPFVGWLFWQMGAAAQRSRGAEISMSDLQFNGGHNLYFVTVTNEGSKRIRPRVYLANATDIDGNRLPWVNSSVESTWGLRSWNFQDECPASRADLPVQGTHADATPFGTWSNPHNATNQQLICFPLSGKPWALAPNGLLDRRVPIIVTIQADCGDSEPDKIPVEGNICLKRFQLSPVHGSPEYSITPMSGA